MYYNYQLTSVTIIDLFYEQFCNNCQIKYTQLSNVTKMDIFEYKYVTCYENGVTLKLECLKDFINMHVKKWK